MEALDRPASPPENLHLLLVAGDADDTAERISIDSKTGEVDIMDFAPGDGTVLRSSALLDERVGQIWAPYLKSPD